MQSPKLTFYNSTEEKIFCNRRNITRVRGNIWRYKIRHYGKTTIRSLYPARLVQQGFENGPVKYSGYGISPIVEWSTIQLADYSNGGLNNVHT